MSAEVLRRAAALMRERATAATPGVRGWDVWNHADGKFSVATHDESARDIAVYEGSNVEPPESEGDLTIDDEAEWAASRREQAKADARFDSSWHPAVALAVADWLDAESESHIHRPGEGVGSPINLYDMPGVGTNTPAMRLARAYLNESA